MKGKAVFYAWQSDLDEKVARYFIKDALEAAVKELNRELNVEESDRQFQLDHDTKGEPGHPDIFNTILRKIDECAMFVADLSFVGATENDERLSNPNVLIELGYAMKSVGAEKSILIMNDALGKPDHLPFDLKHKRWPICFTLPPGSSSEVRQEAKRGLVSKLTEAMRSIIDRGLLEPPEDSPPAFVPTQHVGARSKFFDDSEPFATDYSFLTEKKRTLFVRAGAKLYLRLMPSRPSGELDTKEAEDIARSAHISPMKIIEMSGYDHVRNKYGTAAVTGNWDAGDIYAVSQILKRTKELWGIDAFTLRKERWEEYGHGCLPGSAIETTLERTLANYICVAKDHLGLSLPLTFEAGLTGVEGYRMAMPSNFYERFAGFLDEDSVFLIGRVDDYDTSVKELLMPFFEKLWRECGLVRPKDVDRNA
jgi:hypothetical protein